MKSLFKAAVIALFASMSAIAQTVSYPTIDYNSNALNRMLNGDRVTLLFEYHTGTAAGDTLDSGGTYTTPWVQFGYARGEVDSVLKGIVNGSLTYARIDTINQRVANYDPDVFRWILNLDSQQVVDGSVPDSISVSQVLFELALDTTVTALTAITAFDSTHIFIKDGNYSHSLYGGKGGYLYENITDLVANVRNKPVWGNLRVGFPGYIRFKMTHDPARTATNGVAFDLYLVCIK